MLRSANGGTCADRYAALETKWYSTDSECKAQVKLALETYTRSECPSTAPLSKVWTCMNGWSNGEVNGELVNDWIQFLKRCELLYIAQRDQTAESEDGFKWIDNSCFSRFKSLGEFNTYITNPDSGLGSTTGGNPGSATSAVPSFWTFVFGGAAALMLANLL
ncbi:hypothetical protein HYH03_001555 [Edaphochlamys debaryana]|uniref:Uncharacterized protein n=1 Tax=Edaphochlamys debaryana TaxID=47281 RepID=A0A835YDN5_9CHLO|nr:hypothetical protein HYH03_001555 [Edaphochlamys debaryana]|eukprot:KAG2500793.1 hypothetical protein HYH03_001555 [Edaphochlamys debaryana]